MSTKATIIRAPETILGREMLCYLFLANEPVRITRHEKESDGEYRARLLAYKAENEKMRDRYLRLHMHGKFLEILANLAIIQSSLQYADTNPLPPGPVAPVTSNLPPRRGDVFERGILLTGSFLKLVDRRCAKIFIQGFNQDLGGDIDAATKAALRADGKPHHISFPAKALGNEPGPDGAENTKKHFHAMLPLDCYASPYPDIPTAADAMIEHTKKNPLVKQLILFVLDALQPEETAAGEESEAENTAEKQEFRVYETLLCTYGDVANSEELRLLAYWGEEPLSLDIPTILGYKEDKSSPT